MDDSDPQDYGYSDAEKEHTHNYLWPPLQKILSQQFNTPAALFDLGCGNGSTAHMLSTLGWKVTGVDQSASGIYQAKKAYPDCLFKQASAYDDLKSRFGQFPVVLSFEVVEHLFDPRTYAKNVFDLVCDDGIAIISTPYHGYWKNLALALSGKMDAHFGALWDGGHIKFWSIKSLTALLTESGFKSIEFQRVGRIPALAKSMIAVARK